MSNSQTYARALCLRSRSSEQLDRNWTEKESLQMKAARYRLLAETLVDPRVIAVVQACARDLEMQAILAETSGSA